MFPQLFPLIIIRLFSESMCIDLDLKLFINLSNLNAVNLWDDRQRGSWESEEDCVY